MNETLSNAALATLSAVADAPSPPDLNRLHELTNTHHNRTIETLLTVARLERAGLVRSKDVEGVIGYHITVAGLAALGD